MKHAKGGIVTIALFAVAATLLVFSVVGSSQAALTYFSETYGAEVSMLDIGVTLVENGEAVSSRDYTGSNDAWNTSQGVLVGKMLNGADGDKEELKLGHKYKEELAVTNTGKIDEYVRVSVYRYWEMKNEATGRYEKAPELDSSLIDLHLTNTNGAWSVDESSTTEERTVLYYNSILPVGATTPAFSDTLEIKDEDIEAEVTRRTETDENGNTVIITEYDYDNARFVLRADVDAVQTHNATDAMISAWGTTG